MIAQVLCLLSVAGICLAYVNDDKIKELEQKLMVQEEIIKSLIATQDQLVKDVQTLFTAKEESDRKRFLAEESPVAFTAAIAPLALDHVKHEEIIRFETTITDINSGYNNSTGVFVVPVTGIYLIASSLTDHWGGEQIPDHGELMVHGEIVHNHKVVARIFAHAEASHRDQGAQTVFIYANEGDQVYVRCVDNENLGLGGELYSSFSGFLMYPMY